MKGRPVDTDLERLMMVDGFLGAAFRKHDRSILIGFDTEEKAKAWWDQFHAALSAMRSRNQDR